ncbi:MULTISPECIES: DUF4142 domain-containing protein [unclassified Sphingomonas]|uniref:DUF4142 domain-containing protein n=1 Tax=unclassified Sphingomonas TaxID=196159 RepID=UPI000B1614CA|nr:MULTISPECIES: DUF4142 domain-containing protein [unclassified Sphingomonas]
MSSERENGPIKDMVNKVADTFGGAVGQVSAAVVSTPDGFVESAAIGDRYEIAAGRIALARSRNPQVQQLARQMIVDHTTNTHHLLAALEMNETRGVAPPPDGLDTRRETMIRHLEESRDEVFDVNYLDQQVLAHEETVTLMKSYGARGENVQLRALAQGAAPVVERHLAHVKRVRAGL